MNSILLVEDREGLRRVYASFLRGQDYTVVEAGSVEEAFQKLEGTQFSLVLTDYMLPGANGLSLLKSIKAKEPDSPVIVMTAFGEVKLAVEAIKAGAVDFLEKPVDLEYLKLVVARALGVSQMTRSKQIAACVKQEIVGQSPALHHALSLADKVAPSQSNCLLLGESGVGKELFAKRIHAASSCAQGEIVSINCASIPAELMESELFGHERGAFTGAVARKMGLVEAAHGGTLFLDEIGELPLELQPKLLRFIQTRQFFRVGGNRTYTSNVRFICATNRDLKQGAQRGWFREDLYYRLAAFPIEIPPLRDRLEDIPLLCAFFLAHYPHPRVPAETLALFTAYTWPGNIRELENLLERAVILAGGAPLLPPFFPADMRVAGQIISQQVELDLNLGVKENLRRLEGFLEQRLIRAQLTRHRGNREKVAAALGYSIKSLYNKMKNYEITTEH